MSPEVGLKIVKRILSIDQAYGTSLKLDSDSLSELISGYETAMWYSNTKQTEQTVLSDTVQSWSWNPATESTFDMGVIVRNDNIALCIWAEDED